MDKTIRLIHRDTLPEPKKAPVFGRSVAETAHHFHQSIPSYRETPLVELKALAGYLGLGAFYVKDESPRFGLNAFKGLGGSFAIGKYLSGRLGLSIEEMTYERLAGEETRKTLGEITFVTATDGNHGRGIAWMANGIGQKSVVYMPKGSAPERLQNIHALGADAFITEYRYDDAVRFARAQAERNGWVLVQDTAWEGYEQIPQWIMEGYTTMGWEITEQLHGIRPTHLFLQAGVGSMAGAMAGYFADVLRDCLPVITVVEPERADCIFRTAEAMDGTLHRVTGEMNTMMAGLACGEPCPIAWEQLACYARNFASVPEPISAEGMRVLGNPLPGDPRVISGESGAVTTGFVTEIMRNRKLASLREQLGLDEHSRVLCISTEGDTDRENYRSIVWDGRYPNRE